VDRAAFVDTQLNLLRLERTAEIAEAERLLKNRTDAELTARGTTLLRLEIADLEPGFGGRLHAVLRPSRGGGLPAHRFGPGDVVAVRTSREQEPVTTAVVVRARADTLTISLDDEDAELPTLVRLDRMATDITWRRLEAAVRSLLRDHALEQRRFLEVLFGEREAEIAAPRSDGPTAWFDDSLDPSQRAAVELCRRAQHLALIHGPPGTGKTTAVVEVIRQEVADGRRVLACAPSNVAVDNLAERLMRAGVRVVRIGHPARVQPFVREAALSEQVERAPEQRVLRDVRRELEQGLRRVQRAKTRRDRAEARDAVRSLRAEIRQIEAAVTRGLLDGAEVVLATTTGAADQLIAEMDFDLVVVDEAAQALEAACWIPLQRARRTVLAGDHRQLPPTIQSAEAAHGGLAHTMFERLAALPSSISFTQMLTVQYRMHERIAAWSAQRFYEGRVSAAPVVARHLLNELSGVETNEWTTEPLCFVDTAGCGHEETVGDDEGSKANPGEAGIVARVVTSLLDAGVPPVSIGVITPYNAQVQLLRGSLGGVEGLEIGTVDGLQGREKEAVVLSLVRSNEAGEVGFLAELRRLNVALTRARRHLTVVGDSATLAYDADLRGLVDHLQQHAHYRSGFEFS
jgi:ATP-dependent RNA/DNA helicase IGHMBP2